jgi:hypothetical protein
VLDYVSELPDEILSATGEGDVVAIARWLDSGGNVNGRGERRRISSWEVRHCGITVLMEASLYGNEDLVSMLLDRGAAIHLHDSKGNTALHMAACNGTRNEAGNACGHATAEWGIRSLQFPWRDGAETGTRRSLLRH